jgi:hypothetical protein
MFSLASLHYGELKATFGPGPQETKTIPHVDDGKDEIKGAECDKIQWRQLRRVFILYTSTV